MKSDILQKAEQLFFSRGYRGVTLQDIATELGIRPASLYYHFKDGKEEIYLEVIKLRVQTYKAAVESIAFKENKLENILLAFGFWYIKQPSMNMSLIAEFDMPHLTQRGRMIAMKHVGEFVFDPLRHLFLNYSHELRGDLDPQQLVSTFNVLLYSTKTSAKMSGRKPKDLIEYCVSVFLNGVRKREAQKWKS
ncbi:MAG: TetR/AcrR family transcriptional regulator [Bdellovibrionales bacterium]|nr:TetR/AcrR family transcriptional regulator [Bdellovibrionales bacterium]